MWVIVAVVVVKFAKQLCQRLFLEESELQNLQDFSETVFEIQLLLNDGNEDIDADGAPYLCFYGVLGGIVERFDSEMRLKLLVRNTLVNVVLGIEKTHPAQRFWIQFGRFRSSEDNGLIGTEAV